VSRHHGRRRSSAIAASLAKAITLAFSCAARTSATAASPYEHVHADQRCAAGQARKRKPASRTSAGAGFFVMSQKPCADRHAE
jgi:hypothetical protein